MEDLIREQDDGVAAAERGYIVPRAAATDWFVYGLPGHSSATTLQRVRMNTASSCLALKDRHTAKRSRRTGMTPAATVTLWSQSTVELKAWVRMGRTV